MGVKMAQGIFYSRSAKGVPKDIITWHDKLPIRIFIHSQENEDTSRTVLSITTQIIGEPWVSLPTSWALDTSTTETN